MARRELRRILLVEGNPDDRARLKRLLRDQRRRYDITDVGTGRAALERLTERDAGFDCVLLDHQLPDMTADQLLRELRHESEQTPVAVCIVSGLDDDDQAAQAIALGAEDYLLKDSVTPPGLVRAIENTIERFAIRRQLETQRAALDLRNERLESMREELEARLMELSEAQHSRDRFVAMMSHEMRTPLNAILGYSELLEMEIEGHMNEAQRRNLERIRVGSRHLLDLINNVLDLARADARRLELDLRPVNANAAIEEVVALLEHQASLKKLTLTNRSAADVPLVHADLQRLRQIMTNLVGNAIKFTESGGITIAATSVNDGNGVAIAVTDSGIGIPQHSIGEVFKEFYQADDTLRRVYGGSGLGLAISQRLARAMHGDITVTSRPGHGSVFTLILPSAHLGSEARAEDTASHDSRMAQMQGMSERRRGAEPVNVVAFADDAESLAVLERSVRPGVDLAWTTDAAEVPALVADRDASLVILDISAREGSAWRVAQQVNEKADLPPAILLLPRILAHEPSGTGTAPASAVDLGWLALVPKPFTADQLTRAVSTAAGRGRDDADAETPPFDVLVIDDDEDSRRVALRFLREKQARVRECADGESGLVEMRLRPPDVVVLDLMMPVLDGFGVLATMRADPLLASIPVVVLTAKTLTEAERRFLTRTAARVLQKGEHRLADIAALVIRAAINARSARRDPTGSGA